MRRIINWFACHSVVAVLFVFLVVAVIFRDALFGISPVEVSPVGVSQADDSADAPAQVQSGQSEVAEEASAPMPESPMSVPESEDSPETGQVLSEPEQIVPEPVAVVSEQEVVEASVELVRQPEELISEEVVSEPVQSAEIADSNETDPAFRPENESPASEEQLKMDLLQKARRAYWNDQLNKPKSLYLAYIDLDQENPDGYGELGNLLGTAGELDEAARMYGRAAELLMQQNRHEEAEQLRQVLDSISVIKSSR